MSTFEKGRVLPISHLASQDDGSTEGAGTQLIGKVDRYVRSRAYVGATGNQHSGCAKLTQKQRAAWARACVHSAEKTAGNALQPAARAK
eukprot:6074582-Pleurochrysis_carterae.AAC.1